MWDIRRIWHQARKVVLHRRIGQRWEEKDGFALRSSPDYATYVEHQKTKFSALRSSSVLRHDRRFHAALAERLAAAPLELRGRSVLCLAARQGTEVRAFIECGAFAVGIDLNPGLRNRHVVVGDFHDLQFADGSVDYVFTNSLDHAFDLDRIVREVCRVLRSDGVFIVEANAAGEDDDASAGPYEATVWKNVDALIGRITAHGFQVTERVRFEVPWVGEQLLLRRTVG
jgi:SAM-dependent methyltransferase